MDRIEFAGRTVAATLAAGLGANALVMLGAPFPWYEAVPGVTATGPYNSHFVRDIGAAYLVAAGGLAGFSAWPRSAWPALAAAAAFLALHAAIHVYDAACGRRPFADLGRDFAGVFLPALLAGSLALVFRPQGARPHAEGLRDSPDRDDGAPVAL